MLPVSGLASWVVVCFGSITCLAILGINVQPLLTVGGVSTVLVGLSAQSVLANLISGINLVSHLLLQQFLLDNNCIGFQENCPYIQLSLPRSTVAYKMQCPFPSFVVLATRMPSHGV